jgi:hypothetical protein
MKKKIADQINDQPKENLESGLDQPNQSVSSLTTKQSYDTVGAMDECEKVVSIIRM